MPIPSPNDISTVKLEIPLGPPQRDILMSQVIHTHAELSAAYPPTIKSTEYTKRSIGNQTLLATKLRLKDGLIDGFVKATSQLPHHRSGFSFAAIRPEDDIFWRQINPYDGSALSNEDIADKLFALADKDFPSRAPGQELTDAQFFDLLTAKAPENKLRASREFKVEQIDDGWHFSQDIARIMKETAERRKYKSEAVDEAALSSRGVMRIIQLTADYSNPSKLQNLETAISSQLEVADGVNVTKRYQFSIKNPLNNRAQPSAHVIFTGHPLNIAPYSPPFVNEDGYKIHAKDYVYQLLEGLNFLQNYIEAENSLLALPPITRH